MGSPAFTSFSCLEEFVCWVTSLSGDDSDLRYGTPSSKTFDRNGHTCGLFSMYQYSGVRIVERRHVLPFSPRFLRITANRFEEYVPQKPDRKDTFYVSICLTQSPTACGEQRRNLTRSVRVWFKM